MTAIICTAIATLAAWDVARRWVASTERRGLQDLTKLLETQVAAVSKRVDTLEARQQAQQLAKR